MAEEKVSGKIVDWKIIRRLFQFIRPYKTQFVSLVALILVGAALAPVMPMLIRYTIDRDVTAGNHNGLTFMLLCMVGVLVLQGIVQFASSYLSGWLGQTIIRDIRGSAIRENSLPPPQVF